jgi:hypothetical protein
MPVPFTGYREMPVAIFRPLKKNAEDPDNIPGGTYDSSR